MKQTQTKFITPFHRTFPAKGHKGLGYLQDAFITIKSKKSCILTPKQLEASRRILSKPIRKQSAQFLSRVFPNLSISKKPLQTRMGKGKGRPYGVISCLRQGAPLFTIRGKVPLILIRRLYRRVNFRLPVYSKLLLNKKVAHSLKTVTYDKTIIINKTKIKKNARQIDKNI